MFKITFKRPVAIIQDELPAEAVFTVVEAIEDKGDTLAFDGNEIPVSLIKGVEWEAA